VKIFVCAQSQKCERNGLKMIAICQQCKLVEHLELINENPCQITSLGLSDIPSSHDGPDGFVQVALLI